jgi:Protein of unknown function (DUF3592)
MITSDDRLLLEIFMSIAAFSFAFGFWIRRREQAARDWPQASGVIVASTTLRQYAGHGTYEKSPVIEYEFSHDGRSFRSDHWRPLNFSVGNSISAQAVTSRYPVGQSVTVFVNPRNPMRSVLEFQPSWLCWVPFGFGILFVALSALALVVYVTR